MGGRLRVLFPPLMSSMYSLSGVIINLLAIALTDYKQHLILSLVLTFSFSAIVFYFVESPFFLYKKKNIRELYDGLIKICRRNFSKKDLPEVKLKLQETLRYGKYFDKKDDEQLLKNTKIKSTNLTEKTKITNLSKSNETISVQSIDKPLIFKSKKPKNPLLKLLTGKNLFIFIKVMFTFITIETIFGMSLIINKDLGISNVYLSGVLVAFFQSCGYLTGAFVILKYGRRTLNIFSSIMVFLLTLILMIVDLISNHYVAYSDRSKFIRIFETGIYNKALD